MACDIGNKTTVALLLQRPDVDVNERSIIVS